MENNPSSSGARDRSDRSDNLSTSRTELLLQLLAANNRQQQPLPARTQENESVLRGGLYPNSSQGLLPRSHAAQMPSQNESLELLLARSLNPSSRTSQLASLSSSPSYLQALTSATSLAPLGPSEEELLTRLLLSRLQASNRQQLLNELLRTTPVGNDLDAETLLRLRSGGESLPSLQSRINPGPLSSTSLLSQASARRLGAGFHQRNTLSALDDYRYNAERDSSAQVENVARMEPPLAEAAERRKDRKRGRGKSGGSAFGAGEEEEPSSPKSVGSSDRKKQKRASKKKPADMPRRPLSAYNLFFSEERERILREISEEGAEKEKVDESKSSDDEKKPAASTEAKTSGDEAPEAKDAEGEPSDAPAEAECKALRRPLVRDSSKRRPHRKTHGKVGFKKLAQMVGQRWRSLPSDRLSYYQKLADEDMKRHKVAMEEYYKKKAKKREGEAPPDEGEKEKK